VVIPRADQGPNPQILKELEFEIARYQSLCEQLGINPDEDFLAIEQRNLPEAQQLSEFRKLNNPLQEILDEGSAQAQRSPEQLNKEIDEAKGDYWSALHRRGFLSNQDSIAYALAEINFIKTTYMPENQAKEFRKRIQTLENPSNSL